MLTIQFPNGVQEYAIDKEQDGEIWIEIDQDENGLYLNNYFKGYSFYLEEVPVAEVREIALSGKQVFVESENAAELAGYEGQVDLQVTSAIINIEKEKDHLVLHVKGYVCLHDTEDSKGEDALRVGMDENDEVPFSFSAPCSIRQGDFQLEFAYGSEYSPAPDTESLDELIEMAKEGLHEMADESNNDATELVSVVDWQDESSLRIYGRGNQLIIEGAYPIDGKWCNFVLAHRNTENISKVTVTPDSVNQPMEVESDEFFTVSEAEQILEQFLRLRFLDTKTYLAKNKRYIF